MKTDEIIISKVKAWLDKEGKSYQDIANELNISKAMVGHVMSGKRVLQPYYIEPLAKLLNKQMSDLLQPETQERGVLTYQLRGSTSNRHSKIEFDSLLFAIEDYVGLKEQLTEQVT
ncbi:helix-turn-helix domain-containing protein [Paenibacillus sp. 2TAB23]|uniref:helix-turn-helix domain-containing protein n=1 Tax=Paenibacillus sp. 2TAB23 TaxID=3233004 RepID=UPI003F981736